MGKWEQGGEKKDYTGRGHREVGIMMTWVVGTGQWKEVGTTWASIPPIK